ncbi:ribose-phosphate diphosphokinase [Enterococcus columbae]|uniref:Ribose-phosphate pyrophosphokinase n=1 Tax=Enterococcus columbae DSM 7374 = ATCC 51263 TaxID=1121865 RepID=S1N4L7_9ENTE|nr:ribose-phosphate diphosphokinase [Enterococcus columbae]EOT39907.1 ribose-phosphate pyrophosphokinase [Enterococcus columbae DSM 7374 = ATCC 51263]EOW83892.1 ribose-phosphate pyrophosphokinase [Enterococcus columbae DSM 7374 = ATCC 51263]OJG20546.1 ribose-phosphate pyrophosphokinase [Enterococcus columbae DSM 7374 = ATCC 51263]
MVAKQATNNLKIFSLNGNQPLAEKIAKAFGQELGKCVVRQFSDGEIAINIEESVRGVDTFIIQSTNQPVNDYYWELLIMIDAMKRASAKTINVVLPYYAYARQDRTAKPHEPITAKLIANMLTKAGATRVLTLDLHTVQVQGFFDIPVDNLFTIPLFAKHYLSLEMSGDDYVVVSPKNSGVQRARSLAEYLGSTLAIVDQSSEYEAGGYVIGDVKGKKCIMVDDILNTGQTFVKASELLLAEGAVEIYACASHALLSQGASDCLSQSAIKDICVTDSCYVDESRQPKQLTYITCADLMGEALRRIHENTPMSPLFRLALEDA